VQIPWSDVNPQASIGNSLYNAFTVTVTKRFANNFQMLSGWTWSHTIDDSTDFSTLLNPQNNNNPDGERGNSNFDQRHRWINSAAFVSPYRQSDQGFWNKLFAEFTAAPILEVASGRPYNVLIGFNPNLDFGTATNRPSFLPAGTSEPPGLPAPVESPFIKGKEFIVPTECLDANSNPFPSAPFVPSPSFGCGGKPAEERVCAARVLPVRLANRTPFPDHRAREFAGDRGWIQHAEPPEYQRRKSVVRSDIGRLHRGAAHGGL